MRVVVNANYYCPGLELRSGEIVELPPVIAEQLITMRVVSPINDPATEATVQPVALPDPGETAPAPPVDDAAAVDAGVPFSAEVDTGTPVNTPPPTQRPSLLKSRR